MKLRTTQASPTEPSANEGVIASQVTRVDELAEIFSALRERTTETARRLKAGEPPPEAVPDALRAARSAFFGLSEDVQALVADLAAPPSTANSMPASLDDLRAILVRAADAARARAQAMQTREAAIALLDRTLAIVHPTVDDFSPLRDCHDIARDIRHRIAGVNWAEAQSEIASLAEGEHPFAFLVALVEQRDGGDLDDEAGETAFAILESKFGRPLALAAVRGRLHAGYPSEDTTRPADSGVPPPVHLHQESSDRVVPTVDMATPKVTADEVEAVPIDPVVAPSGGTPNLASSTSKDAVPPDALQVSTILDKESIPSHPPSLIATERLPQPVKALRDSSVQQQRELHGAASIAAGDIAEATFSQESAKQQAVQEETWSTVVSEVEVPIAQLGAVTASLAEEKGPSEPAADAASSEPFVTTAASTDEPAALLTLIETEIREEASGGISDRPRFGTDVTAQQIALSLKDGNVSPDALRDLSCRLLLDGRLGLAYHVVRAVEVLHPGAARRLPSWLVRALALAPHVRYDSGDIATMLRADVNHFDETIFVSNDRPWNRALRFFLIAAALRPSLLAPSTGAAAILGHVHLKHGFGALSDYVRAAADFGPDGQPLDAQALKGVRDQSAWDADLAQLRREVKAWQAQAPLMKTIYARATNVWRSWMAPAGLLANVLQPILSIDADIDVAALSALRTEIDRLADDSIFQAEVDQTDRNVNKRIAREQIRFDAFTQLHRNWRKSLDFVHRWIALQDSRPGQPRAYHQFRADQLRANMWQRREAVQAELGEAAAHLTGSTDPDTLLTATAVELCRRAVEDTTSLFDPEAPLAAEERPPWYILHADLLRIPSLPLGPSWEPEAAPSHLTSVILDLIAADDWDWPRAFARRAEERDHDATERIINLLAGSPDSAALLALEDLRQIRARNLHDCRQALQRDAEATSKRIEAAVTDGLLREAERNRLAADAERIHTAAPDTLRFGPLHAELRKIREDLDRKRDDQVAMVKGRLDGEEVEAALAALPGAESRIRAALAVGDIAVAVEYLDMVRAGNPLPDLTQERDPFTEFIDKFQAIDDHLNVRTHPPTRTQRGSIPQDARLQGPVTTNHLPGPQKVEAQELYRAWHTVKKQRAIDASTAATILRLLGFPEPHVALRRVNQRMWLDVTTQTIADRKRSPVHAYGSTAEGRYRILCDWARTNEADLLDDVGETANRPPVIVFYFGIMTPLGRRNLARQCRDLNRTVVVLDDALVYFLRGVRGPRLHAFFACALPFTSLNPYVTTPGHVPPEVFYGRRRERTSLEDPFGSTFIYGGRQLGKTALLREIVRSFASPAEGRLAVWLDLRNFGHERPVDDVWLLIAESLHPHGVLPGKLPHQVDSDRLIRHLETWLTANRERRILLFLDEADTFLETDAGEDMGDGGRRAPFARVGRLKGLMDRTQRRFKVVFAGLHNVLRTARDENQPLAHLNDPLRIGPLLDNGEWSSALQLIEEPFASVGYRFESPDLPTRILARTNYYPSLIQLYCNQLHRHVSLSPLAGGDRTRPTFQIITSRNVDEVYQSRDLRSAIRDRFLWTLDLDKRYRVIAYSIALYRLDDAAAPDGFTGAWVQEQALTWWEKGFHNTSFERVLALLGEMVELGVLQEITPGHYALRSLNVVALLGTRDEIERELEENTDREAPQAYDQSTSRVAFRDPDNPHLVDLSRRSPLTALQENQLRARQHGISIVCGTEAGGLSKVAQFLRAAVGPAFFVMVGHAADRATFAQRLDALELANREHHGTTIVFIEQTQPWGETWLAEASARIRRMNSRTAILRFVFLADPAAVWRLLPELPNFDPSTSARPELPISLQPWDDVPLRRWLEDTNFGPGDAIGRRYITDVTGNWPALLDRLCHGANDGGKPWQTCLDEIKAAFTDPAQIEPLARLFGLDQAVPRRVLRDLAFVGEASDEDLIGLVEGEVAADQVTRSLRWAEMLGLARRAGGQWQLDTIAAHLLQRLEP